MRILLRNSIKRLRREGIKSLVVPLIALTLTVLINSLGGVEQWLNEEYEYAMENYAIIAQVSDHSGNNTTELNIDLRHIELFTDPDAPLSLYGFTSELLLRRTMEAEIADGTVVSLIGITARPADETLSMIADSNITFFDGYDESIFQTNELIAVISDDLVAYSDDNRLSVSVVERLPGWWSYEGEGLFLYYYRGGYMLLELHADGSVTQFMGAGVPQGIPILYPDTGPVFPLGEMYGGVEFIYIEGESFIFEEELHIIGIISDDAVTGVIYSPFWAVNMFAGELTGLPPSTELLSMTLYDNRDLTRLKGVASMHFSHVQSIGGIRPFALTIYDSAFYETLEPLVQNTILIGVATPIIYIISMLVGILTSMVLTRQRKAEFAILRSVGVSRKDIFIGALGEQFVLCVIGTSIGFALVAAALGYLSFERALIFLACYMLGAIISAIRAAGTNVLLLLRERE